MVNVIAEIGINHKGSTDIAKKLIDNAADSKCWGVKFQYRKLQTFYNNFQEIGDGIISEELSRTNMHIEDFIVLAKYATSKNLKVGISFFRVEDFLDFKKHIELFDFFKVPSGECTNTKLIDILLSTNKQVIVSTGGHSEEEIKTVLSNYKDTITVLHCVANYPVRLGHQNLNFINKLKKIGFKDVGYSSHDSDIEACLMALCYDIKWIERHITLDKFGSGLDDNSSSEIDDFIKLNRFIKNLKGILSNDSVNQGEILNIQNLSTGLYAKKSIPAGTVATLEDFEIKAPRKGLGVGEFLAAYTIPLTQTINENEALSKSHFSNFSTASKDLCKKGNEHDIGIPVRLHDFDFFKNNIPLGLYEFHLSYQEILQYDLFDIVHKIEPSDKISIHLPDYLYANRIIDPISDDVDTRKESRKIIEIASELAQRIESKINRPVPVLGSFSVVTSNKQIWYDNLFDYTTRYSILPQWLPVYAWYLGGSQKLSVFNSSEDIEYINKNNIDICLDLCHLILSANYYEENFLDWYSKLIDNTAHIHIADATGVDSEGLEILDEHLDFFQTALKKDCYKILEVWQGHLNKGKKFITELDKLLS